MKIKIKEKGWAGFNGHMGTTEFKDAVSVSEVDEREALRLGALIHIVTVNDAGEEGDQVSSALDRFRLQSVGAPVMKRTPRASEIKPSTPAPATETADPGTQEASVPAHVYTREELEGVADQKGIKGLRDIGAPLGAKATAIPALIDAILSAQKAAQKTKE